MKLELNISSEDYRTLNLLAIGDEGVDDLIREAIKVYICNWVQYIPYMNKHTKYIMEETLKSLGIK